MKLTLAVGFLPIAAFFIIAMVYNDLMDRVLVMGIALPTCVINATLLSTVVRFLRADLRSWRRMLIWALAAGIVYSVCGVAAFGFAEALRPAPDF